MKRKPKSKAARKRPAAKAAPWPRTATMELARVGRADWKWSLENTDDAWSEQVQLSGWGCRFHGFGAHAGMSYGCETNTIQEWLAPGAAEASARRNVFGTDRIAFYAALLRKLAELGVLLRNVPDPKSRPKRKKRSAR